MSGVTLRQKVEGLIFETPFWKVFLADSDQTYLGRSYVTLKRHAGDLADLTDEEWQDLHKTIKKFEIALRKAFGAEMFNWTCLMNDAYQETPANPHVHWHVRPRYSKSVEFTGLTFEDKDFGHHYTRGTKRVVPADVRKAIIEKIKESSL